MLGKFAAASRATLTRRRSRTGLGNTLRQLHSTTRTDTEQTSRSTARSTRRYMRTDPVAQI